MYWLSGTVPGTVNVAHCLANVVVKIHSATNEDLRYGVAVTIIDLFSSNRMSRSVLSLLYHRQTFRI